ncbi:putative chromosome segregation protein [Talaromyces proteolyticus]|uniref:Chromosome segregation protein n=1 Tax=Talaromyces proteolyticus TaxID=1131652 RepID=A0AAD4KFP6_9EURO|nr:putative chromosome segregation protein [Talaromyces proteolyticus]KAH8690867.1 putative chromosome segregation protein [Talaromyces proteolyticus]
MPPKRKAVSNISGLVDSDSDNAVASQPETVEERPAKKARGRPKSSGAKIEEQSAATRHRRSSSAGIGKPDAVAKKTSGRGRPRGATIEQEEAVEPAAQQSQFLADVLSDAVDQPADASEARPGRAKRGRGRKTGSMAKQVTEDGEFEYTPTGSRQLKTISSSNIQKRVGLSVLEQIAEIIPDSQAPAAAEDQELLDGEVLETTMTTISPAKNLTNGQQDRGRKRPTVTFADTEKTSSDPDLRRRLGDMTKKYETLESKYRTLRDIGVVEANSNVEKIKKQCETVTNASNKLIASLKEELAAQKALGKESSDLHKQLRDREKESNKLQSQVHDLSAQLSTAQTEIKTLQTRLAAARNNVASAKTLNVEAPGSAVKNTSVRRAAGATNTEALQVAQLAQLKEDLYGDLTGLIIRSVKENEADHMYDCIQTGVNGTLQFKLAVAHERGNKTTASLDTAEFQYMPQLDPTRDAALISLLPEYLTVDITFSRQNASKFYTRVMDSLTKRRIDPEE